MGVSILSTKRLWMRPYRTGDLDRVAALYADPEVTAFTKLGQRTRAQTEQILEQYLQDWDELGFGMWAVFERVSDRYVGETGLFLHRSRNEPALRYAIAVDYWGKGYATEAVEATITQAFAATDRKRLLSIVQTQNAASLGVMGRLGLIRIGADRDGAVELHLFAVTRADWHARSTGAWSR